MYPDINGGHKYDLRKMVGLLHITRSPNMPTNDSYLMTNHFLFGTIVNDHFVTI